MVYEMAKKDPRVVFIGSDLGIGTLKNFKEEMPDRFFMEGVSEANIIGVAAGMALDGRVPYINTIATFITRRCFEQVVLDLCLHNVPVRLIGSGGGVVYAPLGPTHLATDDIAILRALPNMTIIAPADADEMKRMMPLTLDIPGPVYIRLGKGGDPLVTTSLMEKCGLTAKTGKALHFRTGNDILIITTGIMLKPVMDAAKALEASGIQASVLHMPTIKPLDSKTILELATRIPAILTVEEHTIIGGLGSAVAEIISEAGNLPKIKFKRLGLPDRFPEVYGSQASILAHYGLDTKNIVLTAKGLVQK